MTRQQFLENIWQKYPVSPDNFTIAGRLDNLSNLFVTLQDKGEWSLDSEIELGPLQSTAPQTLKIQAKDLAEILRPHDWVALKVTNLENKSVMKVTAIHLLAPALENPRPLSSSFEIQAQWSHFLGKVRDFFSHKGFSEVQTPTLVSCPGTEPFLDLFSTEFSLGEKKQKMYLPTSPELHLKKMLAAGYENIFEIRSCFRNGEVTTHHRPEFTMLEWYRPFADLNQILQDTLHLLEFLGAKTEKFKRQSMAQLFEEKLNFRLTPKTSLAELKKLAVDLKLQAENYALWDDVFYLIFIEKIEPFLSSENPLIVEKYPPSQAALARLTPDGWGDRFELYWQGLEIANAFHELNDPTVQLQRFQEDLDKKKSLGKEIPPLDQDFMQALRSGMPPSGGIALGLERLFMALHGYHDIHHLKPFPPI